MSPPRPFASGPKVVSKRQRATLCGSVVTLASNVKASGELTFVVTRKRGKLNIVRTFPYYGGKVCLRTKRLKKRGRHTVHVTFTPQRGSVFDSSSDSHRFKVRR